MKSRIVLVARVLASALSISVLTCACSLGFADDWQSDIQLQSCECAAAGDCACGCGDGCSCGCGVGCGDPVSSDFGYCLSCPMWDELTTRMTSSIESMAAHGFEYVPGVTQFYQGVASGGDSQVFDYGGKVDQFFILDSGKLGLWDGMTMNMHVESRFGEDVIFDATTLAPVNVNMLYPKFNEHDTAITGLSFAQALGERVQATFGKFNALDLFYTLYPQTGRGIDGFMNASMVIPVSVARVVPLAFMGAGAMTFVDKKPQGALLVYDTQSCTTTSGFDDLGNNGANILGFWRFFTDFGGLPGSQGFLGIWSTGEFVSFDRTDFVIIPGEGLVVNRQSGAFSLVYIAEQTLWMDSCNKARNISFFSQCGLAEPNTSPIEWSANVAIQAQGFNSSRPHDSMGIGYFHTGLSDDLRDSLRPLFDLQDLDGVELYYNMAVMKGFQVTSDLQVIEPAERQNDTAVVAGLRATLGF